MLIRWQVKKATAGSQWFNLPRTNLTPELKRDLQLLHMRGVLDPKRHYKKAGSKLKIPEFSQVGTIIEGPTEFFSGRLSNKDRKRTFTEEVMNSEKASGRFKNKYGEIQAAKTSGKKAHYKALKTKRSSGRVSKGWYILATSVTTFLQIGFAARIPTLAQASSASDPRVPVTGDQIIYLAWRSNRYIIYVGSKWGCDDRRLSERHKYGIFLEGKIEKRAWRT